MDNGDVIRVKDIGGSNRAFSLYSGDYKIENATGDIIGIPGNTSSDVNFRNYEWHFYDDTFFLINLF
jgi:hypothetical protein